MSGVLRSRSLSLTLFFALAAALLASPAAAQSVTVTVPPSIAFLVTDVTRSTSGTPSASRVSFEGADLGEGMSLRISVQADTSNFVASSGPSMAATLVSWTAAGASGGLGWNGALSASTYSLVYQSDPNPQSGFVDLDWTLGAPGSGIRAGDHDLAIRWKVESIDP